MILQQLWHQAKVTKIMHDNINETAALHGEAFCHLVENYDCDPEQVDKTTDVLDKIGKALDVANSLPDSPSRTQYINRITDLLSQVREQIKDMVDCIKNPTSSMDDSDDMGGDEFGGQEENEEFDSIQDRSPDIQDNGSSVDDFNPSSEQDVDMGGDEDQDDHTSEIDAFLDKFLSDIEQSMAGGDGDYDEDDGYPSSDNDDSDMGDSDDMASAMGSERDQDSQLAGDDEQHKPFASDEDEEMSNRKRRFGNYRMGSMRNTYEGQRLTFSSFLMETQGVAPSNPMLDTNAQYSVFVKKSTGPEKIAGPFSNIHQANHWLVQNGLSGSPLIHVDVDQPSDV